MNSVDAVGNLHDTTGRFAGHLLTEGDPCTLVAGPRGPVTDDEKSALAPFAGMARSGYDSQDLAGLQRAMPASYQLTTANRISDLQVSVDGGGPKPISDRFASFLVAGLPGGQVPDELVQSARQPHFDTSERDWLAQNAGTFVNGYDSRQIEGFARSLPSVELACVWSDFDTAFHGDSELFGRVGRADEWRRLSPEAWSYLFEAEDGAELPEKFLADEPADLVLDLESVRVMAPNNFVLHDPEYLSEVDAIIAPPSTFKA